MSRAALILAAHGSRHEPAANELLRAWAATLAARGGFDDVWAAFHQGEPTFAEALDQTDAVDIVVVPVMTSEGYYCDEYLPAELAKNRRYGSVRVRVTPPVGVHAKVPELVETRGLELAARFELDPGVCGVALIGHGTRRSAGSRVATARLAEALRKRGRFAEVAAFYLDEPPTVEEVPIHLTRANILVLPFLISGGPHAVRDVPSRLGLATPVTGALPLDGKAHGCRMICDAPFGTDPRVLEIIADLAKTARSDTASPQSNGSTRFRPGPAAPLRLRLGTRGSRLARWQADHVAARLRALGVRLEIVEISTAGDRLGDVAIADLPGDAPFTDDIDAALARGEIDLAVHSLKDLPVRAALAVAAVLKRGEVSESLVARADLRLAELPPGATVGTSSPRRVAQLLALRPDLVPVTIRGAVDDRVRQVRAERFDAAILATAGLSRLGLLCEAGEQMPLDLFLPAPGQGAMAVQCRSDDAATLEMCRSLEDAESRRAVTAELEFLRPFEFDRTYVAAAYAIASALDASPSSVLLRARLLSLDGQQVCDVSVSGNDPTAVARRAIDEATARLGL
ncbi:MAG: hydroxymethylbilane synthase [Planctomycetota bacterium]|nr:MAG: hydroxymethylbilane synthase [Planctomycetota bacterium]